MEFSYIIEDHEAFKIVKVYGNLSVLTAEVFERVVQNLSQKTTIILDLSDLNVMTSAGMDSLVNVSIAAKEYGNRVMILHISQEYYELAETLSLLDYFIIIETLDEGKVKIKYYS